MQFGLKRGEIEIFERRAKGLCEICLNPQNGKRLALDHDHSTGKVRGLLCDLCNKALGSFRDSILILESAIEYLQKAAAEE